MTQDVATLFSESLRKQADRPFEDVEHVNGRTPQPFSQASSMAARNLLVKARRALARRDVDRATRFVDRAVALPYDPHEKTLPAAWSAHMELFEAVADALEVSAPEDSRWLQAALDVLAIVDERARYVLRDVLEDMDQYYVLSRDEHRRLHAATAGIPARAPLRDLVDLPAEELRDHVLAVAAACNAFEAAMARAVTRLR